jgi:hypothetical protein
MREIPLPDLPKPAKEEGEHHLSYWDGFQMVMYAKRARDVLTVGELLKMAWQRMARTSPADPDDKPLT